MSLPEIAVVFLLGYAAAGVMFGLWFVSRGAARLDDVAHHGSIGFRVFIFPGAAALWPLLLLRSFRAGRSTS